jgi:hypothetical protein
MSPHEHPVVPSDARRHRAVRVSGVLRDRRVRDRLCVAATALAVVAGAYWPATVSSGCAALNSALLLWGVYRARQQELWRTRIEHDIEASSHSASMLRLQRDQLTRDMARYQSATSERRH